MLLFYLFQFKIFFVTDVFFSKNLRRNNFFMGIMEKKLLLQFLIYEKSINEPQNIFTVENELQAHSAFLGKKKDSTIKNINDHHEIKLRYTCVELFAMCHL